MKKTLLLCAVVAVAIIVGVLLGVRNAEAPPSLGTVRLNVETYLAGENQATHPSIVGFSEEWNGARYWMAYSPYPYANGEEENPCIAVSNDMLYWDTPKGLANPIADNEEIGCEELKDPHLVYREDLDRLEMWYLGRLSKNLGGDGTSLLLLRKYSEDGIHWSEYEIMATTHYLSPSIIWDGEKYLMWSIGYDLWDTEGSIAYQESGDGHSWTAPIECEIGDKSRNIDIWHGAVTSRDGQYHLAFIDNTDKQEVWYCASEDGVRFNEPTPIVENKGYWDYLYRPTLFWEKSQVFCVYGVVTEANQWYLSMSKGEDTGELYGIRAEDTLKMCPLADDVIDTKSIKYYARELYDAVRNYLRIELAVFLLAELLAMMAIKRNYRGCKDIVAYSGINVVLSSAYIVLRLQPYNPVAWIGAILAIILMNIGMTAIIMCMKMFLTKD